MNSRDRLTKEKQTFYHSYSILRVVIHDFALSRYLFKNKLYSWAITTGYYSMIHVGRLLCFVGVNNFPILHSELHRLLIGEIDSFRRKPLYGNSTDTRQNYSRKIIVEKIWKLDNNASKNIKQLGEKLSFFSKVRNNNSYDAFIIAHQINHEILEIDFGILKEELRNICSIWLKYSFKIFLRHLSTLGEKRKYLGLLSNKQDIAKLVQETPERARAIRWGMPTVFSDLERQNLEKESKFVSDIWSEILKKEIEFEAENIDIDFIQPLFHSKFSAKNRDFNNFKTNIKNLFKQSF